MPGLPDELQDMSVRVAGIDTPEIRDRCRSEATVGLRKNCQGRTAISSWDCWLMPTTSVFAIRDGENI